MKNSDFFSIQSLTVGYDGIPLISDINAGLEKGHILTLIGPNGSGKSTILKSIARQLLLLGGKVSIGGSSVAAMSGRELSEKMSVLLTNRIKTEYMTCQDVVESGRYPYTGGLGILGEEDHLIVKKAMDETGVWSLRDREFDKISDGQRQRILLTRAICQQPEVIVLDEPTTYLDIHYQIELMELLRRLAADNGITVIMSLHEIDLARKFSDKILCAKGEHVFAYGSPEEIFTSEKIGELYDIENSVFDPLLGSVEINYQRRRQPEVFVIAGGGTGVPVYRKLQRGEIPFATGILQTNDIDYILSHDIGAEIIAPTPFEEPDEKTFDKAIEMIKKCGAVYNCLETYGTMNEVNYRLLEEVKNIGINIMDQTWRKL